MRPVTVAVGLAKVKPFNPSQRMKNLTSRAITLARFDQYSLEYADEKGILYQREQKNSGERLKVTGVQTGICTNRVSG